MLFQLLERIAAESPACSTPDLRVRMFRSICIATAALALLVAVPMNLLQNIPLVVHVGTALLGLLAAAFAWLSFRGRTLCTSFFVTTLALLDLMWFGNAGSRGSITYFYLPALVFSLAIFPGARPRMVVLQLLNVATLLALEHRFPGWVTPFASEADRIVDLSTSLFAAGVATLLIVSIVLRAYERDRRRLAETAEQLRASEERHRVIFNGTGEAILVFDAEGRLIDINSRALEMYGVDRASANALTFDDCSLGESPYSEREAKVKLAQAAAGEHQVFEWMSRKPHGEIFWSEVALRAGSLAGKPFVIASVRDISRRKQVQHELLANEERLRLAMLTSRQAWFEVNVQTGSGFTSPEYARLLGFDALDFVTSVDTWLASVHPEDRDAAEREFRACIDSGQTRSFEYRRRAHDGSWKWIRSVGRIVDRDPSGRALRMIGMHADITDRKELEAQLLHSQRLEAVGTLASGVAHDLNNILTPMLMGAGLLRDRLADPEDRELMGMIENCGRRGAAIVKQLLAFSRAVTPERRPIRPLDLMKEVAQLVRSTFPKEITLVEQVGECGGEVEADSTQLHQVLVNLAVNARDAMPEGGTLTLGMECCALSAPGAAHESGPPESFLLLRVADTGHGIPPEIRDRIFDPFFTTKGPGKGTGLGLATVHGIVAAHRGFIRFESAPGVGTEFRIYIPMAAGDGPAAVEQRQAGRALEQRDGRPCRTILVVDDEPAVLRMVQRILEREGFDVLAAANGAEALQLMRERSADIALVIVDFMMPEMDGPALVPRLRAIAPLIRIIGVSGLDQRDRAAALGLDDVLGKPFDGSTLVPRVHRVLGRPEVQRAAIIGTKRTSQSSSP